jgi:hypothetical protein
MAFQKAVDYIVSNHKGAVDYIGKHHKGPSSNIAHIVVTLGYKLKEYTPCVYEQYSQGCGCEF